MAGRAGDEVCSLPAPPGAGEAAALVLLDRGLDLVAPTAHGDHPLDRAFGCLPRQAAGHARPQASGRVAWRCAAARVVTVLSSRSRCSEGHTMYCTVSARTGVP